MSIINTLQACGIDSFIHESTGVLTLDGVEYDVTAIILGEDISDAQKKALQRRKSVLKVGTAQYRYAPEIIYPVVYFKI